MNNLVVQLLLKTGTFSTDLKTARGQVQNFQKSCQTAGKSLSGFGSALGINIGSLAKFGGAVGAAVIAGKELKNILDSSQATSDAFQGAIAGCKGVIDQFHTSIATFDFSAFKNGLWDVFDAAKAVRDAIDQLNNTQIAYDYKSKQNQTKFQEAYNTFKDPNATKEMKEDAKKQMKEAVDAQFTYANNYSSSLYKTYAAQVVKKAGSANLSANRVNIGQFEKAMNIDLGLNGDSQKAREENERQYREYQRKLKEYGKNNIVAQDNLKKQYADVIAIHSMLELMKDDELKGVAQMVGSMEEAKQQALSMEKTMNRALTGDATKNKTTRTTRTTKEEQKAEVGSLTYWRNVLREKTGEQDAVIKHSEAWEALQVEIDEATKKVRELEGVEEGSLTYLNEVLRKETELRDKSDPGTEKWKEHNDKVQEAATKIKEIRELEQGRGDDIKNSLIYYNQLLSELVAQRDKLDIKAKPGMTDEELQLVDKNNEKWMELNEKIKEVKGEIKEYENYIREVSLVDVLNVDPPTIESLQNALQLVQEIVNSLPIGSDSYNMWNGVLKGIETKLNEAKGIKIEAPKTNTWDEFNQAMANTSTIVTSLTNTFKENSEVTAASILQMVSTTLPAIGSLISAIGALTTAEAVEAGVAATGKAVSTSKHWIEAIAAVAALGAAVATAIAAASKPNIQKFANGGIVGGSSFTGDRISANVNSGEMILNKSQQARLFQLANGGGTTGKEVTFHISGTDLVGVLNNQTRKNRLIR